MRQRANLIAGAICGVVCVACVLSYASDLRADVEEERSAALARYGGEQVEVFVATDDIAPGDMLDASNSEKRLWLSELIPEGALFDAADLESTPATSPIYAGEVILKSRFDEEEDVALQVPDGKCAVSLPAESVSAVGGSVAPGSSVDVYATSGAATDLIAARVLVLSTSTTALEEGSSKKDVTWITVAVNPEAVAELITASQKSELYFALPSEVAVSSDEAGRTDAQEASDVDGAFEENENRDSDKDDAAEVSGEPAA
ncbi:MAG: Flp pilus assembly protein CpaB [Slackia sp.]|nr:Flp pilus assembly protein CpaB [Slackia sp.]